MRRLVSSCMNMWFAHHLNRGHILQKHSKHGTKHIDQRPLHESMIFKAAKCFVKRLSIINVYLRENNDLVHCTYTKRFTDLVNTQAIERAF